MGLTDFDSASLREATRALGLRAWWSDEAPTVRQSWVCTSCCAGWWNERTTDGCPHCGRPADSRGAVLVLGLGKETVTEGGAGNG